MRGPVHVALALTGLCAAWWAAGAPAVEPAVALALGAATVAGALLPDVDHRHAGAGKLGLGVLPALSRVSPRLAGALGHRRVTHTLVFCLAAGCLAGWLSGSALLGLALLWGALSHVVADATTPTGCPIFWPSAPLRVRHRLHPAALLRRRKRAPLPAPRRRTLARSC